MKHTVLMDEHKLIEKAVGILMQNLGPVETSRFLSLLPAKRKESVKKTPRLAIPTRQRRLFRQGLRF